MGCCLPLVSAFIVPAKPAPNLAETVRSFENVRALVIGDAMIDQYHFGRIDRISPEAPVPIFLEDYGKNETRRGGADNVAHQLEALGCKVDTVFAGRRSVKHRYMVGHYQVFRRDSDSSERPSARDHTWFAEQDYDVIVLSDYAKGFLTPELCSAAMEFARKDKTPVVVDPKGTDWAKYHGCDVICPNERELQAWNGIDGCNRMVVKLGDRGMRVEEYDVPNDTFKTYEIPAHARHVFDVTGAGDCVVAVVSAALGVGCDLRTAATLATYAAGYTVGEVGTTVCPKDQLLEMIKQEQHGIYQPERTFEEHSRNACRPEDQPDAQA